jgi:FecR-like protein
MSRVCGRIDQGAAMERTAPFRLNRSGLVLALISAAFAGQAGAAAGRVEFAVGGATVVGADGRARPVARGAELDSGDTVRTNEGRVQVRMTDGAFVSLQPNTEFGIKNYNFSGQADGTESALYSLVKGAMRTVTGLIGRVNRNRYQVATPTATVGIRGTGGLIQVLNDGSTLVQGTSGIWFLANPAGSIDIPAGVAGLAPTDPKQPPKETSDVPTSGPAPLPTQEQEYVQGEERTTDGESVITGGVLQSGSGYAAVFAYGANFDGILPAIDLDFGSAVFNGAGQMTEFTTSRGTTYTLDPANGSNADFGTDGIVAWGRWIGTVTSIPGLFGSENYSANQGLHYVVGAPTAVMPLSGSATYTLLGATSPTYLDGSSAPGTLSGSLSVLFGVEGSVGMNLNVAMPDGKGYAITGSAFLPTSTAFFTGQTGQGLSATGSGGACSSGCNARVDGFFAGTSAERVGLGYHIDDFLANKDVVGAAAFKKQ